MVPTFGPVEDSKGDNYSQKPRLLRRGAGFTISRGWVKKIIKKAPIAERSLQGLFLCFFNTINAWFLRC